MLARKGFTLVEVLLVVVIIAVLASIVIPRIAASAKGANQAECDTNIANLISAIERYAIANKGAYPADQAAFTANIRNSTNFPHGLPTCPWVVAYAYSGSATGGTITTSTHVH